MLLPIDQAKACYTHADAIARTAGKDDPRTMDQLRADAVAAEPAGKSDATTTAPPPGPAPKTRPTPADRPNAGPGPTPPDREQPTWATGQARRSFLREDRWRGGDSVGAAPPPIACQLRCAIVDTATRCPRPRQWRLMTGVATGYSARRDVCIAFGDNKCGTAVPVTPWGGG